MIVSSKAIVVNTTPYSDSKIIVTLFTEQEGLLSAMYRVGKTSSKRSLIEPFSMVEVILRRGKGTLYFINDISPYLFFKQIHSSPHKRLVTLFMAETIYRTIREQHQDTSLYLFLEKSIVSLDEYTQETLNFIVAFLIEYGKILGIYPNIESYTPNTYFDMQEGVFHHRVNQQQSLSSEESRIFANLLNTNTQSEFLCGSSSEEINLCLDILIGFLQIHMPEFKHIKSLDIMRQVI